MDIVGLISNAFGAIKEMFGFVSKRSDLNNQTAIVDNKEKQQQTAAHNENTTKVNNAINSGDFTDIRR